MKRTAIILAGGKGTRLRPIIQGIPKPMAPIDGKPFLEYLIIQLSKYLFNDIIVSTGYQGHVIHSYFNDGQKWSCQISYSHETSPLGTGGAIKQAFMLAKTDHCLILNGDTFFNIDINALCHNHIKRSAMITLGLSPKDQVERYGAVALATDHAITHFIEKGQKGPGLINGGVAICNRQILQSIPDGFVSFERDVIPKWINKGLFGHIDDGFFIDIGIPNDYNWLKLHATCLQTLLKKGKVLNRDC